MNPYINILIFIFGGLNCFTNESFHQPGMYVTEKSKLTLIVSF